MDELNPKQKDKDTTPKTQKKYKPVLGEKKEKKENKLTVLDEFMGF